MISGRAGVPLEVMGLMLGEFEDDYSVQVVDVFAMPQLGTGVSVEAVDPVFQVGQQFPLITSMWWSVFDHIPNNFSCRKKWWTCLRRLAGVFRLLWLTWVCCGTCIPTPWFLSTVSSLVSAGITPTLDLDAGFPVWMSTLQRFEMAQIWTECLRARRFQDMIS